MLPDLDRQPGRPKGLHYPACSISPAGASHSRHPTVRFYRRQGVRPRQVAFVLPQEDLALFIGPRRSLAFGTRSIGF